MNVINSSVGNIIINRNKCIVDGVEYSLPNRSKGRNISVVDNNVFVDGYELKDGTWKRTLKALWHLWF